MLFRAVAVVYAAREMRKPGTLVPDLYPSCDYVIPPFLALVKWECYFFCELFVNTNTVQRLIHLPEPEHKTANGISFEHPFSLALLLSRSGQYSLSVSPDVNLFLL